MADSLAGTRARTRSFDGIECPDTGPERRKMTLTQAYTDGAKSSGSKRWIAVHLGGIGIVLLATSFLIGYSGYVFIDEAALLAQVEIVQDGSWAVPRPLADVDPEGRYTPMARSTIADERFAPFPNHPLHVLLATGADSVAGTFGVRTLSVIGVVGAALAAGLLAASRGRLPAIIAMWTTAVASPLAFDARLVVAHGIGAMVAGALLVLLVRVVRDGASGERRALTGTLVGVGALAFVGPLLRSEMVLFALAIAIVAGFHGVARRSLRSLAVGLTCGVCAGLAYVFEPWWVGQLVGSSSGPKYIASESRDGILGTLRAARTVLVGFGDATGLLLVLTVLFTAGSAWLLRRRAHDAGPAAVLAAAGIASAAMVSVNAAVVPGLIWAFPVLLVAIAALRRPTDVSPAVRLSTQVAVLFGALVLATQYAVGGGVEWGWRYFAVALPAVGAALALPLGGLVRTATSAAARTAVAGIALVAILVPVSGLLWQDQQVKRTTRLAEQIAGALQETEADLIVAADPSFGRYAWEESIAGGVVTVPGGEAELADVMQHLDDRAVDRLLLVWDGDEPRVPTSHYVANTDVRALLTDGYRARLFVRGDG